MYKSILLKGLTLTAVAFIVSACGNLSKVSEEGTTENPVFPDISDSQFSNNDSQYGSWVNWDNIKQIEKGMDKDQLYSLIGRPHFSEGFFGVREWDYVFNYRENNVHRVCQYKVLFDKNMRINQQFWRPNGCGGLVPVELSVDMLFNFNEDTLTTDGKKVIADLSQNIIKWQVSTVHLVGHTDRLGSYEYNMNLSQHRADTVKAEMLRNGVKAEINAVGVGETEQIKTCEGETGQAEKDCLRPNRRVVVTTEGGLAEAENTKAGQDGPYQLKKYQENQYRNSWDEIDLSN